jgi:hypothetical protein
MSSIINKSFYEKLYDKRIDVLIKLKPLMTTIQMNSYLDKTY